MIDVGLMLATEGIDNGVEAASFTTRLDQYRALYSGLLKAVSVPAI